MFLRELRSFAYPLSVLENLLCGFESLNTSSHWSSIFGKIVDNP